VPTRKGQGRTDVLVGSGRPSSDTSRGVEGWGGERRLGTVPRFVPRDGVGV